MPLTKYCVCGHPNLYTLEVPVFCSSCGGKFESSISVASQKPKITKKPIIELEEDVDEIDEDIETETSKTHKLHGLTSNKSKRNRRETEEDNIDLDDLNISALQLDVPISTKKEKGLKFEDVAFQQKTGFSRTKPKKVNKKKEFEQFQLEAGAGGRKDISIEAPEDKE